MLYPGRSLHVGPGEDVTSARTHTAPFTCITPHVTLREPYRVQIRIIYILLMRKCRLRKITQIIEDLPPQSPPWHHLVTQDTGHGEHGEHSS